MGTEGEDGAVGDETRVCDESTEATPPGKGTPSRRKPLRAVLTALLTAALVLPLSAAAHPEIPAPPPAALPPLTTTTLGETYAANQANAAQASRMAAAHGDHERAAADRAMAAPSRHLLGFDGRGPGRATEVLGDLAHADRIAVLVPGSDTSLDTYARFRATAKALYARLTHEAAGPAGARTAVIAWLGYETPGTISATVTTTTRAEQAAPRLRQFIHTLRSMTGPRANIALLCHSYGSVVCGAAASRLPVDDIALLGSPGTGADSAAALRTRAHVWAARGTDDWVGEVPHVKADLFGTTVGFGTDPVSPEFGARVFAAGDGGHSDYFTPGSVSLTNLARIVLGDTSEVTRA
ncbi:alpha/beta hydrolase [Streptomyces griseus]|uniref:alpha/beta hydrolase n=1 Tax=Streptomyces griseus TaxID=1911 RepID=UPI00099BD80B|nr:alpha/beta hydrolase [Streptomyces griseus]